jgi:uncharacterized Ntn-hydrolase superfamily protein
MIQSRCHLVSWAHATVGGLLLVASTGCAGTRSDESAHPEQSASSAGEVLASAASESASSAGQVLASAESKSVESVVATFSIIAYDSVTGEHGGAVQSRVFSVGNGVLWAEAGAGIVATQAIIDVSYGPQALALLREGKGAAEIVKTIWERDPDPRPEQWSKLGRQFAVVDAGGNAAAYTGPRASTWAGDKQARHVTAQGNILAGPAVVDSMIAAYQRTPGHMAHRLVAALEAGQAAGGDRRGMQSAALLIVKKGAGVWLNNDVVLRLQVDDSQQPIAELKRLVEVAARTTPAMRSRR